MLGTKFNLQKLPCARASGPRPLQVTFPDE